MGKHSLSSIAKSVRTAMKKHSPEILTGIGIAGMITTTVRAVSGNAKSADSYRGEKRRTSKQTS